jgi:hypothetical protein
MSFLQPSLQSAPLFCDILANNDPVRQTGTLKKAYFNTMNENVIFQIPRSTNGETSATTVTNIAVNSVSRQRTLVTPSTVDLINDDPAFIIGIYSQSAKRNFCFGEWGAVHLVPPGYNNDDRMSLTMALIDTLAADDPYNNSRIVMPSMLFQESTLDMMGEEMVQRWKWVVLNIMSRSYRVVAHIMSTP